MQASVTYMRGHRVPQDVIKEVSFPCNTFNEGMAECLVHLRRTPTPKGTVQINCVVWEPNS